MAENIIFYSICFIFSLIGLGAIWEKRYLYTKPFIIYIAGSTMFVIVLHLIGLEISQLFDVRHLISPGDINNQQDPRHLFGITDNRSAASLRITPVLAIVFSAVAVYFTILICLILQLKKRITNRSTTDAPNRGNR